jgi:signal peptidase I
MEEAKSENEQKKSGILEFVKVVLISAIIVIPIRFYIAQPFIVSGASMEPNFNGGEYLIIDELSYLLRSPERGEVIVFRYPLNQSEFFIKRVVGLPGETIVIREGEVFFSMEDKDPIKLDEPYLTSSEITAPDGTFILGENEYFVLGDNRLKSSDSRSWGVLNKDLVVGRAFIRLWPITKLGNVTE